MFGRVCLLCSLNRPVISNLSKSRHSRVLYSSYKSHYSLDRLYPDSEQDVTKPLEKPRVDLFTTLQQGNVEEVGDDEKFSGHIPIDKINVKFSKSGGPGGQNVNKVESKVEMRFHLASAEWLPARLRDKIQEKMKTRINAKGELIVMSQKTRSQMRNVQDCLQKLRDIISEAQRKPKEPDEKSAAVWRMRQEKSTRERLKQKTIHSRTKMERRVLTDEQ